MALKRHRDVTGQEERKRNDTFVRTLREEYGEDFTPGVRDKMELGALKKKLGLPPDASLNDVIRLYGIKK